MRQSRRSQACLLRHLARLGGAARQSSGRPRCGRLHARSYRILIAKIINKNFGIAILRPAHRRRAHRNLVVVAGWSQVDATRIESRRDQAITHSFSPLRGQGLRGSAITAIVGAADHRHRQIRTEFQPAGLALDNGERPAAEFRAAFREKYPIADADQKRMAVLGRSFGFIGADCGTAFFSIPLRAQGR